MLPTIILSCGGRPFQEDTHHNPQQRDRALDRQELLKTSISPTTCGICFDSFTSIELDSLQQNGTKKIDEISKKAHFTLSFTTQSTRSLVPNTKPFAPSRREASEPSSSSSSSPSPSLSPSTDNPKQQMSTVVRSPTITPSISSKDIGIVMPCDHGLCLTCLQSFLTNATQSSQARFPTVCPQPHCRTPIPTESAELVLDPETLEIWYRKLAEVHVANKVCCPKPDCQSIIDLDDRDGTVVTCPECHSSFCASCAVPFHRGQTCEQYRAQAHGNETEEDRAMHQLVQDRHWRHCPSCRFVIEKQQGCNHMVCHCGQSFCYACGHPWNELEARCSQDCESYGVHEDIGVECTIM
ncbi:hypothetical protein BCR41DRAFT_205551 [Lobosporangium transversale]|uniref:RBR-type E3 ubiquitin transferase n=1 Tax=Lobosporangium transversale TaxID=64571 RepID=A0A1Y2H136_9FUNG|nr:hypothetical protein BCR41DRAFT_205551 [Lobosporangium transversale]ORZ26772.1 hypothetical protein BCR41DRAFT_205551 [Lobosporangium transversale]|eukprot:XP_021884535.1 hypothetical protein BCR41DRAFT_205551 [Lobosporangium transversale]